MPTKKHKQVKFRVALLLGFLVLVIVIVLVAKLYPVAIVGSDFVSYADWQRDYQIAQRLDSTTPKDKVFDQFLTNKKKEQLVIRSHLGDNDTFQNEWIYYKTGNQDEYSKLVRDYFSGNENLFETYVVEPEALDALLRIKYNSNFSSNNDAYNKARNILSKLSQGQPFEDLARQESDDQVSGQLGGDIGFVSEDQILPELKPSLKNIKLGEVNQQIIVSRLGYHILYPVESTTKDGQKLWHLKQILIQTKGYDTWLQSQLNMIGAHQLMKI